MNTTNRSHAGLFADTVRVGDEHVPLIIYAAMHGLRNVLAAQEGREADLEVRNADGVTALLAAVRHGQFNTVEYLLEKGADANAADREGTTPLIFAVIKGNLPMIQTLCFN